MNVKKNRPTIKSVWQSSTRAIFVIAVGILFYELCENFAAVRSGVSGFFSLLKPLFIGIAIAFVANMPMRFLENNVFKRWQACGAKRLVCQAIAMLLILAIVTAVILLIVPRMVTSVKTLAENFDSYQTSLIEWGKQTWADLNFKAEVAQRIELAAEQLLEEIDALIDTVARKAVAFTVSAVSLLVTLLLALIFSFYTLYNKEKFVGQAKKLVHAMFEPDKAERIIDVGHRTNLALNNYFYGMIMECSILFLLCFVGMSIFKFPFALLIATITGVFQLAPIVGPWTAGVIGFIIILVVDPPRALWFALFILCTQQFECNIIYPRVVGNMVGLTGAWVLLAVLLGGGLFGVIGVVLCVPITAVLYTLLQDWVNQRLAERAAEAAEEAQAEGE